jgi:hypothetical protein
MNDIDLAQYKIVIFTRSMNFKLFELSSSTIKLPFKHVRVKHTGSQGYLYGILEYDIDYAINIDEDAFVVDPDKLIALLKYCISNGYVNCGFPDGGVLRMRTYNPLVTNPFFNIFDVKAIKEKLNYSEIENFDFKQYDYEAKAPSHLYKFNMYQFDLREPYYRFFLWLNLNFKVLYLDAEDHSDGITTLLKDMNGAVFLAHTWYARNYAKDVVQTKRINQIYSECSGKPAREFNRLSDKMNGKMDNWGVFYTKYKLKIKERLKRFFIVKYV